MHVVAMSGLLLVLSACWPLFGSRLGSGIGASALLVGGALIGIPHGASDFLVAHRLLGQALGRHWLAVFVLAYLALVVAVLAAWLVAPIATLLVFLLISSLHFAGEDLEAYAIPPSRLRRLAHASTPLVPIVTLHLSAVAPFFATMSGQEVGLVLDALQPLRAPLLGGWLAGLAMTLLVSFARSDWRTGRRLEGCELIALAVSAATLPPLVTFAVYFCLIHAVRHMVGLMADLHPYDGRRAWSLSGLIVVPAALVCVAILAGFWSAIAGVVATDRLLCAALQIVAALTVPHMLLDGLSRERGRRVPGKRATA